MMPRGDSSASRRSEGVICGRNYSARSTKMLQFGLTTHFYDLARKIKDETELFY